MSSYLTSGPRQKSLDAVDLGIIWDRLISIADAILLTMVRSSFSILVREVRDIGCAILDRQGRPIAFGRDAVPGFDGMARFTIRHMLERFPAESLLPGDVVATNDPWFGGGHRPDICVMRPVFHDGVLVAFLMTYSHLPDIGGRGLTVEARDAYEEGLALKMVKLYKAGERNDDLFELIAHNVRVPEQVLGDIMANVSGTAVGSSLLVELLEDHDLRDLDGVANGIIRQGDEAMRRAISQMPDGIYRHTVTGEGIVTDVRLEIAITINGAELAVSFAGSSPVVAHAVNLTFGNTSAITCYVLKCLTTPLIPPSQGDLLAISVAAPEGTILNALPPAPTGGRHMTYSYIPQAIMGALSAVIPHRVQADVGMATAILFMGRHRCSKDFTTFYFLSGGMGAMAGLDGRNTAPFPVNSSVIPTEIWERETSLTIVRRALLPDSGGAGEYRGGVGQVVEMRNDTGQPVMLSLFGVRTKYAAQGLHGGQPGARRRFEIDGVDVPPRGTAALGPGSVLSIYEAGGGGFGDPSRRDPSSVLDDVRTGMVSVACALRDYGVSIDPQERFAERVRQHSL